MLKPHVMQPTDRRLGRSHRLRLTALPLTGANAAGFARRIMGQFGAGEEDLYPESWLVLREQEERDEQQLLQQNQLTELTLRLAIQFSQSFADHRQTLNVREEAPVKADTAGMPIMTRQREKKSRQPSAMERQVLLQTLTNCLTTLEQRDRETVREIRQLLTVARAAEMQPAQGGEREAPAGSLAQRLQASSVSTNARQRQLLRQTVTEREFVREKTEREVLREHRVLQAAAPAEAEQSTPAAREVRREQAQLVRRLETKLEQVTQQTRELVQRRETTNVSWNIPDIADASKGKDFAENRRLNSSKKRLIDLISAADEEEQERVWALTAESTELAVRYQRSFEQEDHLETREKLTRLVRELNREEYAQLVTVLARELPARAEAVETSSEQQEERQLLTQAQPLIQLVTRALEKKRVLREELWQEIETLPEQAETAYLQLAKKSDIPYIASAIKGKDITEKQALEQLIRRTKRSQLTQLTQELNTRLREVRGDVLLNRISREETRAMTQLRKLLLEEREEHTLHLDRTLTLLAEDERAALNRGAAALAEERGLITKDGKADFGGQEPLVYLLERSRDPEEVTRQLAQSPAIRELEQTRMLDRTVLVKLNEFTQKRGGQREEQTRELLSGLGQSGGTVLLHRLEKGKLIPQEAETPRERSVERLEELLTFRTQKEYKSFRYHLNEYLKTVELPEAQAGVTLVQWGKEEKQRRQSQLRETFVQLTRNRPEAWERALQTGQGKAARDTERILDRELILRSVTEREGPAYEKLTRLLVEQKTAPGVVEAALPELVRSIPPPPRQPDATELVRVRALELVRQVKERDEPEVTAPAIQLTPRKLSLAETQPPVYRKNQAPQESLDPALHRIRQLAAQRAERMTVTGEGPMALTGRRTAELSTRTELQQRRRLEQTRLEQLTEEHRSLELREQRELLTAHRSLDSQNQSSYRRETEQQLTEQRLRTTQQQETLTEERRLHRELTQLVTHEYPQAELERRLTVHPAAVPQLLPPQYSRPAARLVQARKLPSPVERPDPGHWALPRATRVRKVRQALSALAPEPEAADMRYEGKGQILELRREKPRQTPQAVEQTAARSAELIVQKQAPQMQLLRRQDQEQAQKLERQEQDMREIREQLAQQEALVKKALERGLPQKEDKAQVKTLARAVMKELEGQLRLERQRRGLI